jgi:hypothetical protein
MKWKFVTRFEILTTVTMKITLFWNVMPYNRLIYKSDKLRQFPQSSNLPQNIFTALKQQSVLWIKKGHKYKPEYLVSRH